MARAVACKSPLLALFGRGVRAVRCPLVAPQQRTDERSGQDLPLSCTGLGRAQRSRPPHFGILTFMHALGRQPAFMIDPLIDDAALRDGTKLKEVIDEIYSDGQEPHNPRYER